MADEFATIDTVALEEVTGGRYTKGPDTIKPELIQAIDVLAKAVQSVGQGQIQAAEQDKARNFQLFQQMAQMRGGGGRVA